MGSLTSIIKIELSDELKEELKVLRDNFKKLGDAMENVSGSMAGLERQLERYSTDKAMDEYRAKNPECGL